MTRSVVILLSDKRSGSTFLERALCRHPAISHVDYTPHSYNETHYWVMAARLLERPGRLFAGGKVPDGYGGKSATRKLLVKLIRGNVPDFRTPETDRELVFSGWEALCGRFANPVFFEKSPQHVHHWAALELMHGWMLATGYRVRFVFLYRNPMAVMYSARELFRSDPARRQFGWGEGIRNTLAFREIVGAGNFFALSYESLVNDPPMVLAELLDFLELEGVDGAGEAVRADSLDRWREDPGFVLELDEGVRRIAHYLGYSDDDLVSEHTGTHDGQAPARGVVHGAYRVKNRLYKFYKRFRR